MSVGYEFSAVQNETISGLASRMRIVSLFLILLGLFVGVAGVIGLVPTFAPGAAPPAGTPPEVVALIGQYRAQAEAHASQVYWGAIVGLLQAVILVSVGVWARRAARHFQAVVATHGNDIDHMMSAMTALRGLFSLVATLLVLALLLAGATVGMSLYQTYG